MGQIIASCGHDITSEWFDRPDCHVITKGFTKENTRCTDHQVVCPTCRKQLEDNDQLLKTTQAQAEWLHPEQTTPKGFREQFIECTDQGYNTRTHFVPFKDDPSMLPAFPNKKMREALKSGEWKGLETTLCDRFGGKCSSGNPECKKLRGVK